MFGRSRACARSGCRAIARSRYASPPCRASIPHAPRIKCGAGFLWPPACAKPEASLRRRQADAALLCWGAFLDIAAAYRPRRELQKAAPRNFDAFFAKGQKKTVEIPAVPCRARAARFCNSRLQQGDSSFAMSQSSGRNKERKHHDDDENTDTRRLAAVHRQRAMVSARASCATCCSRTAPSIVADQAGAYWLLDEIALAQRYRRRLPPRNSRSGS